MNAACWAVVGLVLALVAAGVATIAVVTTRSKEAGSGGGDAIKSNSSVSSGGGGDVQKLNSSLSSDDTLLQAVTSRAGTRSLDGDWQVVVDPFETGTYDIDGKQRSDGSGFWHDRNVVEAGDLIEYDFSPDDTLRVPGDWNTQRESLNMYEGSVWYRRAFRVQQQQNRRVFIYFGAANYVAIAWVNGALVGTHEGGFTPFQFDVTRHVHAHAANDEQQAPNVLVVRVNNQRRRDAVPALAYDWWNYGGLTRSVYVVETPLTCIMDYTLRLNPANSNQIAGHVRLDGPNAADQTVHIEVAGVGSHNVVTNRHGVAPVKWTLPTGDSLHWWTPDAPQLYAVRVSTDDDQVADRIGFCTVATRAGDILLNGHMLPNLRGVAFHEEAPVRAGRYLSDADIRQLLGWAKELGCNFVRLAHYAHDERTVRACDELGLLVWEEVPVMWNLAWHNKRTYAVAANQLRETILRDVNRCSVVFWSVGNETPANQRGRNRFLTRLANKARALDRTRLVTAAVLATWRNATIVVDDPIGKALDVIAFNEYAGWYGGTPDSIQHVSIESPYAGKKPLIVSEFGAGAKQGLRGDPTQRWTEEFQSAFFKEQFALFARTPFLRGASVWVLMDFLSPRRLLPHVQDFYNRKGLVSNETLKKQAFEVVQRHFTTPMQQRIAAL